MKTLIVIDVQNDFVTGSLANKEAQNIIPNIKNKIKQYRDNGDNIIFTQDCHNIETYHQTKEGQTIPEHCIEDTWGFDIVDGLAEIGDSIIVKNNFGTLDWDMFELQDVEIIGICTDICVISNAFIIKTMIEESISEKYNITVDSACCAGTTIENHNKALDIMRICGFNVI